MYSGAKCVAIKPSYLNELSTFSKYHMHLRMINERCDTEKCKTVNFFY